MVQRRHHYEQAFERYLRSRRVPYVAVDEARKALLPEDHTLRVTRHDPMDSASAPEHALKSFDFVIYGTGGNLLLEIKGRRVSRSRRAAANRARSRSGGDTGRLAPFDRAGQSAPPRTRLESWVTLDDIESLTMWQQLFGAEFRAAFAFVYWCDEQPPDGLFQELFEHQGRWYAVRTVTLDEYVRVMRTRSLRWRTVHIAAEPFERISQPFAPALASIGVHAPGAGVPLLDPL